MDWTGQYELSGDGVNLVLLFIAVSLSVWFGRICKSAFSLYELSVGLHTQQVIHIDENSPVLSPGLELLSRSHFRQIMRSRRVVPAIPVPSLEMPAMYVKRSMKVTADSTAERIGVSFELYCKQTTAVRLYWGVLADAVDQKKRATNSGDTDATSPKLQQKKRVFGAKYAPLDEACSGEEKELSPLSRSLSDMSVSLLPDNAFSFCSSSETRQPGECVYQSQPSSYFDPTTLSHTLSYSERGDEEGEAVNRSVYPLVVALSFEGDAAGGEGEKVESIMCVFNISRSESGYNRPVLLKQLVLTSRSCFEIQEVFGLEDEASFECVVCLSDEKTTALLPCRHLCVCSGCFAQLDNDKCPVCRAPFVCYLRTCSQTEVADGTAERSVV